MIRIVADVHGAVEALRRIAAAPGPLLVLGDLINFIDYRNLDGIATTLMGRDTVAEIVRLRTAGDFAAAGRVWRRVAAGREDEMRRQYTEHIEAAYTDICTALVGAEAYVTFGNVDRPDVLRRHLPPGVRFTDGEVIEIEGIGFGFAGGGSESELQVPGEVSEEEMAAKLEALGDVDVLCSHVPPALEPLRRDVIGGRQKGSAALLDYVRRRQPRWHYFGDIHQPQAVTWRIGSTRCRNVGYFRATERAVVHADE